MDNEPDYYLSEDEFNKYTQFDNTAYYITIDELQTVMIMLLKN